MSKTTDKTTDTAASAPVSIKNFKSSNEVENFYRFVHDNKLREEAKTLVETVLKKIAPPPKKRGRKKATIQ